MREWDGFEESYGSNDENAIRMERREREKGEKIEYRLIACSCLFRASVYPVDFPVTVV